MNNLERIEVIMKTLKNADTAYYVLDNPIMTDVEYDTICGQYKELTGKVWNDDKVPGGVIGAIPKYAHTTRIKSLDKIHTDAEIEEEVTRLGKCLIQEKFDGLTLVIYPDGSIVTRGDGETGENITHTAGFLLKGKKRCKKPIRGEAMLLLSALEDINNEKVRKGEEPYKNARNAVAGMLRNLDNSKVYEEGIKFVAYNILGTTATESVQLNTLEAMGYDIPDSVKVDPTKEGIHRAVSFINSMDKMRDNRQYEIDGMVIKSDIENSLAIFGGTNHHNNNAVAYKFPNQGEWTRLTSIDWSTGKTGKVVPTANFVSIDLLGTTVSRCTLHNPSIIERLDLHIGDSIYVVKSNDIIPMIVSAKDNAKVTAKDIKIPTVCDCGEPLTKVESSETDSWQLYCYNQNCVHKLGRQIENLASREAFNIQGLSRKTAEKIVDLGLVEKLPDIFYLGVDDIATIEGFATPSAKKLYNNIQKSMSLTLDRFLVGCNIPTISSGKARDISELFGGDSVKLLADIEDGCSMISAKCGEVCALSVKKHEQVIFDLISVVNVEKPTAFSKKVGRQLTIVVTGSFKDENGVKVSRDIIKDIIVRAGHKVTGSVSKNTDYVLVGEAPGSKLIQAQNFGIKILRSMRELDTVI